MARQAKTTVAVDGRTLVLSNLDKLLWPADGITKAELIAYYTRMAPVMLPYLVDRPLVLTRYPDGIEGKWFYHKDAPEGAPDWMPTWPQTAEDGRAIHYLLPQEPAALAYVANLGAIELHPWLSRHQTPDHPDWAVIDLDPAEGVTFDEVVLLARLVKQVLDAVGVAGYPKLSGATGIHIFCPCAPGHTYAETAGFCEAVGRLLLRAYPEKVTLERLVAKRTGKIYVDYLQNRRGQTITAVYGVRPLPGAPVSAPVTWAEIMGMPPRFTIRTIEKRLAQVGDLYAPLLGARTQDLRGPRAQLEAMR
jgi:bifunctional non-homologous end joining protein LigD